MTAASERPLASEAPARSIDQRGRRNGTQLRRALVAVLLMLGCVTAGGPSISVETLHTTGSIAPSVVDEVPVPVTGESSRRQRIAVARRWLERVPARVRRFDGSRRFAHWLPVQFRLMPPTWRGPTILRV